ncbi:MAG: tape measure protein, partial [Gordonibacter sp.]|uniref:tape measure protein n=1 Tax=Gordonibacter sp. TaxID=1968902 RepID=UPI002FC6F779
MAGLELASAYVTLLPKFDNMRGRIEKEVAGADYDEAGKKGGKALGSGVSSGLKGATSSIGSTLKGVVGAAGGVLAAVGFGSVVAEAGRAADSVVKFKQTLGFAGLDTSQIDALVASTKSYADKTVYDLNDVQNVTAQLAANAVPNYDRLAEAAGNLNAVSGGNADTFRAVGMVLTQTAGAGKLTTENWNQLANAIPGASGKLQDAMLKNGAYTGNFREAMEKGQITAEEFNQAMMDLGMTDAAQEAATSTATFEGAFGNLQATVVGGLSELLQTAQPAITAGVNALNDSLTPAFEVANDVVGVFAQAITDGASPIEALTGAFGALPPEAQAVIGAVAGIGTAFAVAKIASSAAKTAKGLSGIASSVASLAGRGVSAGAGLMATAVGERAAGSAAGASAKNILASAVAMIALGGGIALACGGLALLAMSAVQLAAAGPLAIAVMVGLVASIALLALGAAVLGPALTAGAVGFVAFGGAIALVGLGVALACGGLALLATQLPTISEYGVSAALNIAALSLSMLALAPAALLVGAGMLVLGAGLVVAAAGGMLLGAAVLVLAAGVALLAAGVLVLSVGLAIAAAQMPIIAATGMAAAGGIMMLSAAVMLLAPALLLAGAGALVFGAGTLVAGAGALVFGAGVVVAAAAVTLLAAGVALLSGGMTVLAAAVTATAAGVVAMGDAMPKIS